MDLTERIVKLFEENIRTSSYAKEILVEPLNSAANAIVQGLLSGGKILTCGNGGSASLAEHFSTKMLCHFERERPGLPAIRVDAVEYIPDDREEGRRHIDDQQYTRRTPAR